MKATAKYNKSEIMKEAWSIWNDSTLRLVYKTWSDCLKAAWQLAKDMIKEAITDTFFTYSHNKYTGRNGGVSMYKVSNKEKFNQVYTQLIGTFAAKVMMTIAKVQNGVATERQLEIIQQSL